MKHQLSAVLLAAVLPAAALAAGQGFYVQGDVGHASVKAKTGSESVSIKGFSPRVSVGYDYGGFLTALDYTHYKKHSESASANGVSVRSEAKVQGVGLSGIYDFDIGYAVKPYVGARLGINRISGDSTVAAAGYHNASSAHETKLGVGAMVGASYELLDNVSLDAGYRYNYLGKVDDVKLHSNELHTGVRVKF